MKIGNLTLKNNIFLAPMAGVTDTVFRRICKSYGAGLVYSEMISAKGLYYNDKKTVELMKISPGERPCAIQIFGSEPDIIAEIIPRVIETGTEMIDINMGCPMPKIVNNGDGGALMKNPRLAGEIVRAAVQASSVPVTVKFRKGWDADSVNAVEFAKILEANGASAIAVHGRTRMEFYGGKADWEILREVKNAVKIPVIGSGDLWTARDAADMLERTGIDAVMIARGAQGDPFIFRQITELLETGEISYNPAPYERVEQALSHVKMLVKEKGESRGIKEARKHIAWYIKGLPGSSKLKSEVFTIGDFDVLKRVLTKYIEHLK